MMSTKSIGLVAMLMVLTTGRLFASEVSQLLAMSPDEIEALAPVQTPLVGAHCPVCGKPVRWRWSLQDPDGITCPECQQRFPNNHYRLSGTERYLNNSGKSVSVSYFSGQDGKKYFLAGQIDKEKRAFLIRSAQQLANRYRTTGDERYAGALTHLLVGLARNFPDFLVVDGDYLARNGTGEYTSTGGPWMRNGVPFDHSRTPYSWTGSIWGRRWVGAIPHELIDPYADIYNSESLNAPVEGTGISARQFINDKLFGTAVDYLMTFDMHWHLHNNLPYQMKPLLKLATLLSRPEYAHFVWDWSQKTFRTMCSFDCIDLEGPGYHQTYMASVAPVFQALEEYADPDGYIGPDGLHLNHPRKEDNPEYRKAVTGLEKFVTPANGRLANIHDTTSTNSDRMGGNLLWSPPPMIGRSWLINGFKHAVLGAGSGSQQIQTRLEFSDFGNHAHQDSLSLTLYAHGREMFSDIGYQRNRLRTWAEQSFSHNLVVVDRRSQGGNLATLEMTDEEREQYDDRIGGDLEVFVPDLPGISMVRVDGKKAYRNITDVYRRTLIQNSVDIEHPYVVDIFEVTGGRIHDYLLHGSADDNQTGSCNLPLRKMQGDHPMLEPGETWSEPVKMRDPINCYGLFRNVRRGEISQNAYVDFRYEDHPEVGTRTYIPKSPEMQIFLGESPSLRKVGHYNDAHVYDYWMPQLILRHRAKRTVFVTVHEPFSGEPVIADVQRIDLDENSVGIRVRMSNGRVDTYLLALTENTSQQMVLDDLHVEGIAGITVSKDNKTDAWLIGEGTLSVGGKVLNTAGNCTGEILGAMRKADGDPVDAFQIDTEMSPDLPVAGECLVVTWNNRKESFVFGYELDRLETIGGKLWAVLKEDHGMQFSEGVARELFKPNREGCRGTFVLVPSATTVPRTPVIDPAQPPYTNLRVNDFVPFNGSLDVTLSTLTDGADIHYTLDGSKPSQSSPVYSGPVNLTTSCVVKAACFNKHGITQAPVAEQRFVATFPAVDLQDATAGLTYKLYSGINRDTMIANQDLSKLKAVRSGVRPVFRPVSKRSPYAAQFNGYIQVPETGMFTFYSRAHDGAVLYIDDVKVIDAFGRSDPLTWPAQVSLEKGFHKIRVDFTVWRFDPVLDIEIEGAGLPRQSIPPEMLFHMPSP